MLNTRVCEILGIRYPIVQAGMAEYVGPELVAAVSNAGGLGLLGGLAWEPEQLRAQIAAIRQLTNRPFGVNLVLAEPHAAKLDVLIETRVPVISTSWGDPAEVCARAHDAGSLLLHQIQTPAQAARAAAGGVDVIAAQGSDGGGHIGLVGTLALVPAAVDAAHGTPVIASGGIADGRGLAAAIVLGAEGALIGTRFLATEEAPIAASWKAAIVAADADLAWQTDVPDVTWGTTWPGATTRVLANDLLHRWHGREAELRADRERVILDVQSAERRADAREFYLWAGQSAGLVHDIVPAGELVRRIVTEAERALRAVGGWVTDA
jgi:NAD(P)H-dependent flavin oxidoreductase YrpB (nitropropane dioxygenase family)